MSFTLPRLGREGSCRLTLLGAIDTSWLPPRPVRVHHHHHHHHNDNNNGKNNNSRNHNSSRPLSPSEKYKNRTLTSPKLEVPLGVFHLREVD